MKKTSAWLLATVVVLGCGRNASHQAEGAFVAGKGFDSVGGGVRVEETPPGVKVLVWLENAPPGPKSVHVYERGDCNDLLADSAGKAPQGTAKRHSGDLGNIKIREDGMGYLEVTTERGNLKPNDPLSFANKAIVIHQTEDKGAQPSGDSEKPVACAVIKTS